MSVELARLIELPRREDARGALSLVETESHVPFEIRRLYWLYGVPETASRGAHAHRELEQVVIAVAGGLSILLDDGAAQLTFVLDRPDRGLYVPPRVWRELYGFLPGTVCLVAASEVYREADYIRDYAAFAREVSAA
ncbi:MAG: WxcM-like domain-containing protein [Polyangiaceae bacterium]|nr:WxcM-like domain-containing protein [Polyangiaceae bacterium]